MTTQPRSPPPRTPTDVGDTHDDRRTRSPDHGTDDATDTVAPRPRRPVDEAPRTTAGLDKVVFGVTAAIAVGFLVWGFVSTASLAKVSGDSLAWTMANTGWLFVLTVERLRGVRALAGA